MKYSVQLRACLLGVTGLFALGAAHAHQPLPAKSSETALEVTDAQALRAVRDKATGKLRAPTADELKAMDAAERAARKARGLPEVADPAPLIVTRHANGMLSARLPAEYLVTVRAERRPDGSLKQTHDDPTLAHPVAPRNVLPTE